MPIRISVRVSPGARRTEVVGRHGGGWRVRVAAPPERGRANEALIEFRTQVGDIIRTLQPDWVQTGQWPRNIEL